MKAARAHIIIKYNASHIILKGAHQTCHVKLRATYVHVTLRAHITARSVQYENNITRIHQVVYLTYNNVAVYGSTSYSHCVIRC